MDDHEIRTCQWKVMENSLTTAISFQNVLREKLKTLLNQFPGSLSFQFYPEALLIFSSLQLFWDCIT